jgi:ATP-binding cassette subfamily D (ALD) long-chain fatty acid import protein
LRKFTPPFGRLIAEEQRLEGNYRFAHSRVITNAEEIAFYGGSKIEKGFLDQSYKELVRHVNKVLFTRLEYGTIEDYIVK